MIRALLSSPGLLVIASALLVLTATRAHAAEPASALMAEKLFDEGRALLQHGRLAEACPKLAESEALDPAVGTLLNLGDCYEKIGRLASAWATFREASAMAHGQHQTARDEAARAREASLEHRLARLTILVPANTGAITVDRDGAPIGSAAFGAAIAVDPGTHVVSASAPGKRPWSTQVIVGDGASTTVAVPALVDEPATLALPPAPPHARGHTQAALGYVALGVGAAALATGAVAALVAMNDKQIADKECPPGAVVGGVCGSERGVDASRDAHTWATASTVAIGAGGGLVATGVVLLFTRGKDPPSSSRALRVVPSVSARSVGMTLGTTW